jgi:hypothetical protein
MGLGAGGERGDLLVPDMDPLDLSLTADGIGQTVQTVADDAVNALDARGNKRIDELVSHGVRHWRRPP